MIPTCSVKLELRFLFEESSLTTLKSDFIRCPSSKGTITFAFNPCISKKKEEKNRKLAFLQYSQRLIKIKKYLPW